jgi:imidazolonepropionase-like amidohydrolase
MLFRAHRLFDGRTPKVLRDCVVEVEVEVEDGRILDVGPRSRAASGSDAGDVVDLGDVTLLPGLIDVYQHLVFDASDDPVAHLQAQDDAAVLQWMHRAAQRAPAVGITTIRDLGDRNYLSLTLRDLFRDSHEVGPRILAVGPPLTVSGGHCWFLGGVADGEDGVRRAVRERRWMPPKRVMSGWPPITPNAVRLREPGSDLAWPASTASTLGMRSPRSRCGPCPAPACLPSPQSGWTSLGALT